jgi:hypothetical protein
VLVVLQFGRFAVLRLPILQAEGRYYQLLFTDEFLYKIKLHSWAYRVKALLNYDYA